MKMWFRDPDLVQEYIGFNRSLPDPETYPRSEVRLAIPNLTATAFANPDVHPSTAYHEEVYVKEALAYPDGKLLHYWKRAK